MTSPAFSSPSGVAFADFYTRDGLLRIDRLFLQRLAGADSVLHERLLAARAAPSPLAAKQESALLLALTSHLDDFIAWLFNIESEVDALTARHLELSPLYSVKRLFVQRKAANKYKGEAAEQLNGPELAARLEPMMGDTLTELGFAKKVVEWQKDEAAHVDEIGAQSRRAHPRRDHRGRVESWRARGEAPKEAAD